MTRFNVHFLSAVTALALVAGCSFQDVAPGTRAAVGNGAPATFAANRTQLVQARSSASNAFGLSSELTMQFRTCVVDRATTQALRSLPVMVLSAEGPIAAKMNSVGCIDWTEVIPYQRLAAEHWLEWPRTVEIQGERLPLALAIDPWARGGDTLIDYSEGSAPVGMVTGAEAVRKARLGLDSAAPAKSVGAETSNLQATQLVVRRAEAGVAARGSKVDYKLAFSLVGGRRLLDGSWEKEKLTGGKFKVSFRPWEQRGALPAAPLAKLSVKSETLKDGLVEVSATVEYQRAVADGSELHLAYRIEPENGEAAGLMASDGWMQLRRGNNSDSATPTFQAPGNLREGDGADVGPTGPEAAVGFRVQSLVVSKFAVGMVQGWSLPIDVKAKVCLQTADDPAQPILATSKTKQFAFEISPSAEPSGNWVGADEFQGNCFTVRRADALRCPVAQPEEYVPMYLHLRGEEARYRGAVQTRRFALNPWQRDRQDLFFVDQLEDEKKLPKGKGVSQIQLLGVSYEWAGKVVRVNEHLQQVGLRRYQMTLKAQLESPYRTHTGLAESEPLYRGSRLRAHGVFSTPAKAGDAPTAKQYLGEFVRDFDVQDTGEASQLVALGIDFPEEPRMRAAVTLTLHLSGLPSTDPNRPKSRTYRIAFDPLSDRPNVNFLDRDVKYDDFLALIPGAGKGDFEMREDKITRVAAVQQWETDGVKVYGLQPKFTAKPIDLFARYWTETVGKLRRVHLADDRRADGWAFWNGEAPAFAEKDLTPTFPRIDRNQMRDLLAPVARGASVQLPALMIAELCNYYAPKEKTCATEPGQFFDAVTALVADKVDNAERAFSAAASEGQITGKIGVSAAFFKEVGYQERAQRGDKSAWTAAIGLQGKLGAENLGIGGGPVGSVGYGSERYSSTEVGVTDALRNRRAKTVAYEILKKKFPMDFYVSGHACLIVRPFAKSDAPALFVCDHAERVERTENWYELSDAAGNQPSVHGDPSNPAHRGWLRNGRGDRFVNNLEQRLSDDTTGAVFHHIGSWVDAIRPNVGAAPGAIVEGSSVDCWSAAGAGEVLSRDGGMFPGVFELNPAVKSYQMGWNDQVLAEKVHFFYNGFVSKLMETKAIASRTVKNFEGADVVVPDFETEATREKTFQRVRIARAFARCYVAEYARRCTTALYDRDRPLCLAKERGGVRALLEPEITAQEKEIRESCQRLAKGAFP